MTRPPTDRSARRAPSTPHSEADADAEALGLPADWDNGSAPVAARSTVRTADPSAADSPRRAPGRRDGGSAFESRRRALLASAPPKLAQAELALDRATTEDQISAARAMLRVSGF